jgi:hypothetical protein
MCYRITKITKLLKIPIFQEEGMLVASIENVQINEWLPGLLNHYC